MKKTRRPRKKLATNQDIDLLKPIDITKLGSAEDPCFGKHHDLTADECQRCGDAELCSIAKAQNFHKKRLSIESKMPFKDIEDTGITTVEFSRDLTSIKNLLKKKKGKWVKIKKLKPEKADIKAILTILKSQKLIKFSKLKTKLKWI